MSAHVAILGSSANETNVELAVAWRQLGIDAELVPPTEARRRLDPDAVAVGRLDVLPSLDGVERGFLELLWLERSGVTVINTARALLAAHDKLRTARLLEAAALPHPRTVHVRAGETPGLEPPLVVKPRFGSWGRDVFCCETWRDVRSALREVQQRPWFRRHGALLQELIPPRGHDLRLIVAGGAVTGALQRIAAPGEWRTNVTLGGTFRSIEPPPLACSLGLAATRAIGADFIGVDVLALDGGRFVVLELNGAVEFVPDYGLGGGGVFEDTARALGFMAAARLVAVTV